MQSDLEKGLTVIGEARGKGFVFYVEEGKVKYKIPGGQPADGELVRKISTYREEIKQLLQPLASGKEKRDEAVTAGMPVRIPLSFGQESLWFIHQLEGSVHYHIQRVIRLRGRLDRTALALALKGIVKRHEVLRTVIREEQGECYQHVLPAGGWEMHYIDKSAYAADEQELKREVTTLTSHPFDLSADHMIRADLLGLAAEEHLLVINIHHIAMDAWSMGIFLRELTVFYEAFITGREAVLPVLPLQYADHAVRQRRALQGSVLERKLAYWKEQLGGFRSFGLRPDRWPAVRSGEGCTRYIFIDSLVTEGLQRLSRSSGATMFMTLLAAFKVLLYRHSGDEDIGVGTVVAGRKHDDMNGVIGLFVNTVVVRSRVHDGMSFRELLAGVKKIMFDAYEHQDLPFEKVVEAVQAERGRERNPLFQVFFLMDQESNARSSSDGMGKLEMVDEPFLITGKIKFDLMMNIAVKGDRLVCQLDFDDGLYTEAYIDRMLGHYAQLLSYIASDAGEPVGAINILTKKEEKVLFGFGRSHVVSALPLDKTVDVLITEQSLRTPDATAVVFRDDRLSYRQLEDQANRLCHYLRSNGVERKSVVGLCVERSTDVMVGLLAILKAGAAFVPVHAGQPGEQLLRTLEETGAPVCLVNEDLKQKLFSLRDKVRLIDTGAFLHELPGRYIRGASYSEPGDLAYILFTSGSTGRPKGVMVVHKSIVSHVSGMITSAGWARCASFALVTSFLADSVYSMLFTGLITGGTLHILSDDLVLDGSGLVSYLESKGIDCLKMIPSLWMSYANNGDLVLPRKVLMFGGEAMPSTIAGMLIRSGYEGEVYNHYGPAEVTIGATLYKVDLRCPPAVVPIGRPYSDAELYVVNAFGRLCPMGVTGELWIGGSGTARGYLGRPELTAERFIPNIFNEGAHTRLYKTGDQVRWLESGNIEFLGRKDEQVKINGYRIEPGEVEAMIRQSGFVKQAVVLSYDPGSGLKRLAAYVVANSGYQRKKMMEWLSARLPGHMVPATWIMIDKLPLMHNGKTDKAALPRPEEEVISNVAYLAPQTRCQSQLVDIWAEALSLDRVGIQDNFFAIGGHSLIMVGIIGHIKQLGYAVRVGDLYDHQTVEALSTFLENGNVTGATALQGHGSDEHVHVLNGVGEGAPVWIIPGSPGFCDHYEMLARPFEGLCPVYGIELPGLKKGEKPLTELEDIVGFVIDHIRRVQPRGPYRIIGHSLGAYLGFELTRRLELESEGTGFFTVLDAYVKKHCVLDLCGEAVDGGLLAQTRHFLRDFKVIGELPPSWYHRMEEELAGQSVAEKPAFILAFVKEHIPSKENTSLTLRALSATLAHSLMRFVPAARIRTPLLVIKAEESAWPDTPDDLGWTGYTDSVHMIRAAGTHTGLVHGHHAAEVARNIINIFFSP